MYCMKCGKEVGENRVFCDACLEVMSHYPVRQGTAVHLPAISHATEKKAAPKTRQPTAEERLALLRVETRWLSVAMISSMLILSVTVTLLIHSESVPSATKDIGKNYNTVNTLDKGG